MGKREERMGHKFVTLIFLFYSAEGGIENDCTTTKPGPPKNHCKSALAVVNGRACYTGVSAYVSCYDGFRFETNTTFKCVQMHGQGGWSWTPSAEATCISIERPASTSLEIEYDTAVSMDSTTVSTLFPSENSMFETVSVSSTFSKKTPTLQSDTIISDYSTMTPSTIHTILVPETVTSNYISASMQPVPAEQKEIKESDVTVVYITIPVVICILALIVALIIVFFRQRRRKSVLKREKPSSSVINKAYENTVERHCSLINVRKSRDSGYAEIPLDFLQQDDASGNVYQTIDNIPEDQIGKSKTYGHLKQNTTKFIDMNYSHIDVNKPTDKTVADTLYDHSDKTLVSNDSKDMQEDGDTTYNRLNITPTSMTATEDKDKVDEDTDTEYNHAKAGGVDIENKADNYSHLNGTFKTPPTFTRHDNQQFDNNENRTKLPNIQPNEFAKETEGAGYEFAKDVENSDSNSVNNNGADKSIKQELKKLTHECVGDQGYETAVGFSHTYFVLEPDEQ